MISNLVKAEQLKSEQFPLNFSARAVEVAKKAIIDTEGEDGEILRVSVLGGGCAGMQYALNFVPTLEKFDLTTTIDGLAVSIDIFSVAHLKNTLVDYEESLQGAGFKFNNPNAKRSCGCGSSFS